MREVAARDVGRTRARLARGLEQARRGLAAERLLDAPRLLALEHEAHAPRGGQRDREDDRDDAPVAEQRGGVEPDPALEHVLDVAEAQAVAGADGRAEHPLVVDERAVRALEVGEQPAALARVDARVHARDAGVVDHAADARFAAERRDGPAQRDRVAVPGGGHEAPHLAAQEPGRRRGLRRRGRPLAGLGALFLPAFHRGRAGPATAQAQQLDRDVLGERDLVALDDRAVLDLLAVHARAVAAAQVAHAPAAALLGQLGVLARHPRGLEAHLALGQASEAHPIGLQLDVPRALALADAQPDHPPSPPAPWSTRNVVWPARISSPACSGRRFTFSPLTFVPFVEPRS